jgi:hypothetical protein
MSKRKLKAERYFIGSLSLSKPAIEVEIRAVTVNAESNIPIWNPLRPILEK